MQFDGWRENKVRDTHKSLHLRRADISKSLKILTFRQTKFIFNAKFIDLQVVVGTYKIKNSQEYCDQTNEFSRPNAYAAEKFKRFCPAPLN